MNQYVCEELELHIKLAVLNTEWLPKQVAFNKRMSERSFYICDKMYLTQKIKQNRVPFNQEIFELNFHILS